MRGGANPRLLRSSNVLAVEKSLAVAHQAIRLAVIRSSELRDIGFHDDLQMVQLELERIAEDLLRAGGRRKSFLTRPAYLSDSPRDDGRPSS